jgi:hypothetical protein
VTHGNRSVVSDADIWYIFRIHVGHVVYVSGAVVVELAVVCEWVRTVRVVLSVLEVG